MYNSMRADTGSDVPARLTELRAKKGCRDGGGGGVRGGIERGRLAMDGGVAGEVLLAASDSP